MVIYTITSNFFDNGLFGTYSTIARARKVLEYFFKEDDRIESFEDIGDYCYQFTTTNGGTFGAEICYDVLDVEFVEGILTDD